MKILITYLLMLSLSLLTACGSSGGGDDSPGEPDPIIGDPNEGPNEEPKDDPVIPSDLDSLTDTIVSDVNENQRFALTIEEYKDTNSYAFTGIDGDNVELSSADGKVVFKVEADFETQPTYNFIMTVTNASDQTKDINVTINIIDIPEDLNSLPSVLIKEADENNRFAFTIPEYKDTNSYVFTGTDADKVKLWPERGEVIFKNAPDFESKAAYSFVMTVTNEMEQTKEIDVTVNIKDITNDFIFEIAEGSVGKLWIYANYRTYLETYETYSFKVKQDDEDPITYDFLVDSSQQSVRLKDYIGASEKTQRFTITPSSDSDDSLPGIVFFKNHARVEIKIIQWGDNPWKSAEHLLVSVCETDNAADPDNLSFSDEAGSPNLSRVNNMVFALGYCDFTEDQRYWDVSAVTNMLYLFGFAKGASDIYQWNMSSVTNTEGMFYGTEQFDQDISGWDVTNVTSCDDFRGDAVLSDAHTPNFQNCGAMP